MDNSDVQRQKIVSSVFDRRNANGSDETFLCHIKIFEEDPSTATRKPRYILLSQSPREGGYMHKSKLNANGTFSVGKTWRVRELRGIQVVNPQVVNITLSRTYRWETESPPDQEQFLEALIRVFRTTFGPQTPLQLEGIADYELQDTRGFQRGAVPSTSSLASSSLAGHRNGPPSTITSDYDSLRHYSPAQSSNVRNGLPPTSSTSALQPPETTRDRSASARSRDTPRNRPPSITVPPHATGYAAPRAARGPAASASTQNQLPSHASQIMQQRGASIISSTFSRDSHASNDTRENVRSFASEMAPLRSSNNASPAPPQHQPPHQHQQRRPEPQRKYTQRVEAFAPDDPAAARRDQNVRISYFDTSNQASLDRLLTQNTDSQIDIDGEEESARATLTNVEEMIEGYEWASDDVIGRKATRGAVDLIQARLLDELNALEKANVHSFLESDDRVGIVMKYLDEALAEIDNMDSLISSYKIHLNAVSEDILFIQSQNRGLQVQTQNQRALLTEIQNLLRTVHVDQEALITLTQGSLEQPQSIQKLEEAASELYKALQAGRDTDMAATMERLQDYRIHNAQFCKRMFDFLTIMFTAQSKLLLGDTNGLTKSARGQSVLVDHRAIEEYLGRYAGLMLYLKEMDEGVYAKLCGAYFSTMSELHQTQVAALFSTHLGLIKKAPEDEQDSSGFAGAGPPLSKSAAGMRRAGTILRSPLDRSREKERSSDGDFRASVVFNLLLDQVQSAVHREFDFITDFLQINDAGLTFADYMGLDSYFRRQAARSSGLSASTHKLMRNAMDLIFEFLPQELKTWMENAINRDNIEIVGILVIVERYLTSAEQRNTSFFLTLLDKQQTRLRTAYERHITDQIRGIEQARQTSKKRRGVVHFIKYFSSYVQRTENQLLGAEGFEIRALVDAGYERIVHAMFENLAHIAKMEGEGDDKTSFHITMLENMHFFIVEMSKMELGSTRSFAQRAQSVYDENLNSYIKLLFRRTMSKLIDFFDVIERLGKDPNGLSSHSNYGKSALKKIVKEFNAKDMRKHIEGLHKRVEKHFTEGGADKSAAGSDDMVPIIWNAFERELVGMTVRMNSLIAQNYGESGIALEFSKADIESACRKQTRTNS